MNFLALTSLALVFAQSGPSTDPAFQLGKQFLGHWTGTVGKSIPLVVDFREAEGGNKIVVDGTIGAGTDKAVSLHSSWGWDPDKKQVYYLDQHGYDTVYFGHVTRDGNALVTDFNGLVGDKGHYRSRIAINGGTYEMSLSVDEGHGKWKELGLHVTMHRG